MESFFSFCLPGSYRRIESKEIIDEPCNLLSSANFALVWAYFSVGFVGSLLRTPLNVYLVHTLSAEPEMQNTIGILQTLPWSYKLLFGFVSDAVPIYGHHRKPYLIIGALVFSAAFVSYALSGIDHLVWLAGCVFVGTMGLICMDVMADTMCVERAKFEAEAIRGHMQASCYSIRFGGSLLGAILGATVSNQNQWGWGLTFPQVALITGLVPFVLVTPWLFTLREKYHHHVALATVLSEPTLNMANIAPTQPENAQQAPIVVSSSSLSQPQKLSVATTSVRPLQHNHDSDRLAINLAYDKDYNSYENNDHHHHNHSNNNNNNNDDDDNEDNDNEDNDYPLLFRQMAEIWRTVQLRAVWRPMAFVYCYNLMQIPNVAWQSFLQLDLHFEPWILGLTVILGSLMTFAGILAYKYVFFGASWRAIYFYSSALTAIFSLLQMLLIFQINKTYLHMNNYLFSLGDDVISAYISGIQFLPVCLMYSSLCPEGAEGSAYAMLTTFGNVALVCASSLGNLLSQVWDVSNDAMRVNDIRGLWRLSLLTSLLSMLPLVLLFLLPTNAEEQRTLAKSSERSRIGGAIFLTVLALSLLWVNGHAVWELWTVWGKHITA